MKGGEGNGITPEDDDIRDGRRLRENDEDGDGGA